MNGEGMNIQNSHETERFWRLFLWLFSFAIVGLTFKQLKFNYFVGPFELLAILLIVGWIGFIFSGGRWRHNPLLGKILIAYVLLSLGTAWALIDNPGRLSIRDALAYAFVFLVVLIYADSAAGRGRDALRIMAKVIGAYLFAILVMAIVPSPMQSTVWYMYPLKIQGFSDNPNQIAFLSVVGMSYLVADEVMSRRCDRMTMLAAFSCGLAGFLSSSSAFTLAFIAVTLVAIVALWLQRSHETQIVNRPAPVLSERVITKYIQGAMSMLPRTLIMLSTAKIAELVLRFALYFAADASRALKIAVAAIWAIFAVPHSTPPVTAGSSQQTTASVIKDYMDGDAGQGTTRLALWRLGIETAKDSPIVGLGPGAHIPFQQATGTERYEAHNTLVDILVVSGIVGVGVLGAIVLMLARHAYETRTLALFSVLTVPVLLFSMFHFVGRQPLFWITFVLAAYVLPARTKPAEAAGEASGSPLIADGPRI